MNSAPVNSVDIEIFEINFMGFVLPIVLLMVGARVANAKSPPWTATVPVDATVSATNVNFGSASVLNSNITATGTVSVRATNTSPYKVQLSYGTGAGAGIGAARYMKGPGGAQISYNLYRDAARTQIWGDSLGNNSSDGVGTGANQSITVYGLVPAQTSVAAWTYTDNITVTVNV